MMVDKCTINVLKRKIINSDKFLFWDNDIF